MAGDGALRSPTKDRRTAYVRRLSVLLHLLAAPCFAYIYLWHFISPLAKRLPGYFKFGWFYRYLTFWTYTLQLLHLLLALLADLFPKKLSARSKRAVGSLACVVLSGASTITTMYYAIRLMDKAGLDPPETRVPWVNNAVHFWNSVVAWLDVLLAFPRDFSALDRRLVMLYTVTYSTWLMLIKLITDEFPYPFLNKLPPLLGWCAVCGVGLMLMLSYFHLAKLARRFCSGPHEAHSQT